MFADSADSAFRQAPPFRRPLSKSDLKFIKKYTPEFVFFFGFSFGAENAPKFDPKIKTFQASPRKPFYTIRAPKKPRKDLPNALRNQIFFSEGPKLENLALASTGAQFSWFRPSRNPLPFRTLFAVSLKAA